MPTFKSVGHIPDDLSPEAVAREYRRRYSLAAYYQHRAELVARLGNKCAQCDSVEELTIVRREGAPEFDVRKLHNMSEEKRAGLLPLVELLCREHANQRLYGKGRVTHGTWYAAYKQKCDCDDCGEYKADYALRRKEDRRAAKNH
jgi:hypothetical protein